jgi:hypothetical protein
MTASITKLALSLGLTLALGFVFMPLGCGGSGGGFDLAAPRQADVDVPEGVALQIRTCAAERRDHLGSVEHFFIFDVKLASNGEADSVALRESTLRDEGLEVCMVKALRSLTEDALPMRRSENGPRGPVPPESRALLGQEEVALACLSSPPCLLTLGFVVAAAYVTVQIYLQASSHPGTRTHHPPAVATAEPTATTAPIATAVPTAVPIPTAIPVARRYPNQTCGDDELDRLETEKKKLCGGGYAAICNPKKVEVKNIPCSAILLAIRQRQACRDARKAIQNKCFDGHPDAGHKTAIEQEENAIRQCEALKLVNCAKGHSMAGR